MYGKNEYDDILVSGGGEPLRELALFAGIGGGILGGKLLGWRTVCAVEREPFCQQVLRARQDEGSLERFPIFDDVRAFDGRAWRGRVDVVSGGFPCQDISCAGRGGGGSTRREADWGAGSRASFAGFDRGSRAGKIPRCSGEEDCPESSVTLPQQGMMLRGRCFPLPTSARRTCGGECGSSPSTETFPTPRTKGLCGGTGSFQKLAKLKEAGKITEEERRAMVSGNGGALNPEFVEWLMGFPAGWSALKD